MGYCLVACQKIEYNLANSYIFTFLSENHNYNTIKEIETHWKKLTFGVMFKKIKNVCNLLEEVELGFDLFLSLRNDFVHGLTNKERYDFDTTWGKKELVPFLILFIKTLDFMEEVTSYSLSASIEFLQHHFKVDEKIPLNVDASKKLEEEALLFFELFNPKFDNK